MKVKEIEEEGVGLRRVGGEKLKKKKNGRERER